MARSARPTLIAIGGHEERQGEMTVLREMASRMHGRKIVVATLASDEAGQMWQEYRHAFREIGLQPVHLQIEARTDATGDRRVSVLEDAAAVFFTGGDQLSITSKLGGTALCDRMHELYLKGTVIAGTSAGASVLTETMIVSGSSDESHRVGSNLLLAPGLAFITGVVIDQHFAQRGRIGRLLGIVGQNPRALGLGLDENTAIVIQQHEFRVVGSGAIYVLDGRPVTHSNVSEAEQNRTISVFNVRLHVLSEGDWYSMASREPAPKPPQPETADNKKEKDAKPE